MGKVRIAIVGVGNCASSLIQGIEYYRNADPEETVPGLMHVTLGGYHVSDVEFVAAFERARAADATARLAEYRIRLQLSSPRAVPALRQTHDEHDLGRREFVDNTGDARSPGKARSPT